MGAPSRLCSRLFAARLNLRHTDLCHPQQQWRDGGEGYYSMLSHCGQHHSVTLSVGHPAWTCAIVHISWVSRKSFCQSQRGGVKR